MMPDIADFVTARLNEEEAIARNATEDPWRAGKGVHTGPISNYSIQYENTVAIYIDSDSPSNLKQPLTWPVRLAKTEGNRCLENATHIAYWDPARVLREVAAKRRILTDHKPMEHDDGRIVCLECCDPFTYGPVTLWPCDTLRALASVWSDHPDFQPEWNHDAR